MIINQVYTKCLSQASYYIGSEGDAVIIDPIRDVNVYLEMAEAQKTKIRYVLITHFHADFISGHLELAARTGAGIVFGPNAKPQYPALVAEDGSSLYIGNCRIKVLHTPGHTIESSCFLLHDEKAKPYAVFTGDTLFVGDTGRPDLLSGNLDSKTLASMLYDSIQGKIKTLSDDVIVYPGHGAGSACGKNLGKETWSTMGEQKRTNYALKLDREQFINTVTSEQPLAPAYFFKDAAINAKGYDLLDKFLERGLKGLSPAEFKKERAGGAVILDTRSSAEFEKKFIKGSINIGLEGQFAIWVGTLIDFNDPLLLVTEKGKEKETLLRLARVGYENVIGYLNADMTEWESAGELTDSIQTAGVTELNSGSQSPCFLDVRNKTEYDNEHVPGAIHIPLASLIVRLDELDKDKAYAVFCAGGYRSMMAASILKRNGFERVTNIAGGIAKIKATLPGMVSCSCITDLKS